MDIPIYHRFVGVDVYLVRTIGDYYCHAKMIDHHYIYTADKTFDQCHMAQIQTTGIDDLRKRKKIEIIFSIVNFRCHNGYILCGLKLSEYLSVVHPPFDDGRNRIQTPESPYLVSSSSFTA